MFRLVSFIFLIILAAHPARAGDGLSDQNLERYQSLIKNFGCLQCMDKGLSIETSQAPLAIDFRKLIATMIAEGRSDKEITRFLVDRYGDTVLYNKPLEKTVDPAFYYIMPIKFFLAVLITDLLARRYKLRPVSDKGDRSFNQGV